MSRHLHTILRHAESLADDRPDADLLSRFLRGRDEHAFAALVRRHGPMVWGVCRNLLPADADAEDAFQATFLALVRGGRRVRDAGRLAAWLHGVAFRVAMKARRTAARRRHREATAAAPEAAAPVADAAWHDLLAAVHEEVGRLPDGLRTAFVLCCLEGRRQTDAAAQLGLKPNTLTTRLARARQKLLDNLTRRGIAPAAAAGVLGVGAATGSAVPVALAEVAITLVHAPDTVSPTVLHLAQGAFDMTTRTKWLAAALLVTAAMTTTVATVFFADATGQQPGFPGGNRPAARGESNGRPLGGGGAFGPAKWEYKVVLGLFNTSEAEKNLNALGDEGWELVATPTEKDGTAVFKRAKGRTVPTAAPAPEGFEPATPMTGTVPKTADAKEPAAHVIPLKHAQAGQIQDTLSPLLNAEAVGDRGFGGFSGSQRSRVSVGNRVKLAADTRTNSLIVIADDATLKTIKELLDKLDVPEAKTDKPSK